MSKNESSPLQQYLGHLEKGELAYQYSPAAGKPVFYPRVACPFTGGDVLEWRVSSGRGVVYSTSTLHPQNGEAYNVSLIDLDDGFRMMSRVEGIGADEVKIGMEVMVRIVPASGDEPAMPVFFPVGEQP